MKKAKYCILLSLLAFAGIACFNSCEKEPEVKEISVESVFLNKDKVSILEGDSINLEATISPTDATNKNVTWESSKEEIASVDENGKVTAIAVGNTKITVRSVDGGKTDVCEVEVLLKPIPVTEVKLNKTKLEITEGESEQLVATVLPENATNPAIKWESSDPAIASIGTTGNLKAKKVGKVTITVTSEDGNKKATCDVSVIAKVFPVTGVSLNKPSLKLKVGDKDVLIAIITPENATNKNVTWTSKDASIVKVDNKGNIEAMANGETEIIVTTEDGNFKATCKVTVAAVVTENYVDEYGIDHGKGTSINCGDAGNVVWAPVNCGYHAEKFKYGKLYQWGRKYGQGYDSEDESFPTGDQIKDAPVDNATGNSEENKFNFYKPNSSTNDWCDPQLTEWASEYSPCPAGWRLPSATELKGLIATGEKKIVTEGGETPNGQVGTWYGENSAEATKTDTKGCIFLPATGYRFFDNYTGNRGSAGYYWTITPKGTNAEYLGSFSTFSGVFETVRANAYSIRCVKE